MTQRPRELWWAFSLIVAITLIYGVGVTRLNAFPAARSFFGHGLGVVGFVLMLMTEILYSLRKRVRTARWGRMSSWLRFHIVTGIVGPYMVLLHTAWQFKGLAGLVMLMTVIIVVSGFLGRYIYTAIPRTADGFELEVSELERQMAAADAELQRWLAAQPALAGLASLEREGALTAPAPGLIFARSLQDLRYRWQWRQIKRGMDTATRAQATQLERLNERRRLLRRQIASLAMARRFLGLWHSVHVPIGMALFTAAFIHIGAALYYATLLH
jgi:hypothetical protein